MEWPNTTAMLPPKYHASIKARESVEAIAAGRTVAVMASPVTRKEYLDLQATGSKLAYAAKDDRGEWVVGQSYEVFEECYPRGDDPTEGLYLGVSLGVRGADFALGYVDETGTFQSIPTYHSATLREDVFATAYAGRGLRQRL
jgi:hypothetical protein